MTSASSAGDAQNGKHETESSGKGGRLAAKTQTAALKCRNVLVSIGHRREGYYFSASIISRRRPK